MKSIFTVLQDIERLIYRILLWFILLPKTLIRIVLEPRWAAQYVRSELNEGKERFDEYMSPVILLLVVSLLPALGYNALPQFGATLSSPAETTPTTDRFLSFEARGDFISSSPQMNYYSVWTVSRKNADGSYSIEARDWRPRADGSFAPERIDNNSAKDRFLYSFAPGEYRVEILMTNEDPQKRAGFALERYEASLSVVAPLDSAAPLVISREADSAAPGGAARSANFLDLVKEEKTIFLALALMTPPLLFAFASRLFKVKMENIGEETLKESFYIQCYYFSPLSAAVWGTYYAYYFFTADAYWYVDSQTALQILLLPLAWAVLWFARSEIKRVAWELDPERSDEPMELKSEPVEQERHMPKLRRLTAAFLVVLVCALMLGYAARIIFNFERYADGLRLFAIRAFPAAAILLLLAFGAAWLRRRREKNESVLGWNVAGLAATTLVFLLAMNWIGAPNAQNDAGEELAAAESQPAVEIAATATQAIASAIESAATATQAIPPAVESAATLEATATPEAPASEPTSAPPEAPPTEGATAAPPATELPTPLAQETPVPQETPTPLEPQFYTEEFNEPPMNWLEFMTFGDTRMVRQDAALGKLSVSLRPIKEKTVWYYLINDSFVYNDVSLEAVVANRSNNNNGVSLICRYSAIGWYEFFVSNGGLYHIYAVDYQGIVNHGYNLLADGGSSAIKAGFETNVYKAVCRGNALSLYVNDEEVKTVEDRQFQFAEGKIGLAVSSPKGLPVWVEFESLTVGKP